MRYLIRVAALFAAMAVAAPGWASERRIAVTGSGEVAAAPDMAMVRIGVTHEARQAQTAMNEVSGAMTLVTQKLAALGIETRDLQTSGFSLNPVWQGYSNGEKRRITGFTARNGLSVRVRALDDLGEVLGAVIGEGANTLSGIEFAHSDPGPLMQEARRRAVADAIARAQVLADAAQVTLGPVTSIVDVQGGRPMPRSMEMARMASSADVPVMGGELSFDASVSMEFEIVRSLD